MSIITEEMRVRKKMCDYSIKYGVSKAARRYNTNRQFIYRQLKKYDGSVKSLALISRRPKSPHPNRHTVEEIKLIKKKYKRFAHEGLAEVYAQLIKEGYLRSFNGMKRVIRKYIKKKETPKRKWKKNNQGPKQEKNYPGELVQVDIKYVPKETIRFDSKGINYYQITAIDTYSSKRVLEIVDEKSATNTALFAEKLEEKMGFKIECIQTDNGSEFMSVHPNSKGRTIFQLVLDAFSIQHIHTRPYSPWQNGIVERSHRIDGDRFYSRHLFKSKEELIKKHSRYANRYNSIAKQKYNFKSPNQVVESYFKKLAENAVGYIV